MAASGVLVLPSFRDGTPRAITEGMASGLPIVATNIAGIPEQVEDGKNGYLVDPGDPTGLAQQLERLTRDPTKRADMGEHSQTRVEAFSMENMLNDLDDVYASVLNGADSDDHDTERVLDIRL